jgi:hypothetical protein
MALHTSCSISAQGYPASAIAYVCYPPTEVAVLPKGTFVRHVSKYKLPTVQGPLASNAIPITAKRQDYSGRVAGSQGSITKGSPWMPSTSRALDSSRTPDLDLSL